MKTKNKVISYKLAKKIYEAAKKKGIELPKSEWWWVEYSKTYPGAKIKLKQQLDISVEGIFKNNMITLYRPKKLYPAFDTTELLEILPEEIEDCHLEIYRTGGKFTVCYIAVVSLGSKHFQSVSLPEALGKLLLYLLENDLVKSLKLKKK